jgi:oligopeptide/dipeptide ABC transporter ATP-binding protein
MSTPRLSSPSERRPEDVMTALLTVENLRTTFYQPRSVVRAVDGVSFRIPPRHTLGIVGESGSGKSVTAMSIMRLIDPPGRIETSSAITFNGLDLLALGEEELSNVRGAQIAMIFQEPMRSLNPLMTVGAQISETLRVHERLSKGEAWNRAVESLGRVGIADPKRRASSYPHEMSGGMRQRAMIAMATVCRPRLLIADEPTTALDVTIQAQILKLMRELREIVEMSMLIISHDFGVIAQIADDVAVMYGGKIVEYGPVVELLESPRHPYTQALLQSVPVLGRTRHRRLKVIPGNVPSPINWPSGCRFAPRCAHAFDRCAEEPPTVSVGTSSVSCWLQGAPKQTEVGETASQVGRDYG